MTHIFIDGNNTKEILFRSPPEMLSWGKVALPLYTVITSSLIHIIWNSTEAQRFLGCFARWIWCYSLHSNLTIISVATSQGKNKTQAVIIVALKIISKRKRQKKDWKSLSPIRYAHVSPEVLCEAKKALNLFSPATPPLITLGSSNDVLQTPVENSPRAPTAVCCGQ